MNRGAPDRLRDGAAIARAPSPAGFRRLAWVAAAAAVALIALGGVVRVTGSGMGCGDDWPLCRGSVLPPLDLPTAIEYAHRLAAAALSALVLILAGLAWVRHRREPGLRRPAFLAAGLLLLQVLLGAAAVRLGLPAWTVVLHLLVAMLLLATLVVAGLNAAAARRAPGRAPDEWSGGPDERSRGGRAKWPARVGASRALALATLALGGLVANLNAGPACPGFPLCGGALLPEGGAPVLLHWTHRLFAFTLVALLGVTWSGARGLLPAGDPRRRLAGAALGLALLQVAIAAAMVLSLLPPGLRAAHLALAAVLWAVIVALRHLATGADRPAPSPSARPAPRRRAPASRLAAAEELAPPGRTPA